MQLGDQALVDPPLEVHPNHAEAQRPLRVQRLAVGVAPSQYQARVSHVAMRLASTVAPEKDSPLLLGLQKKLLLRKGLEAIDIRPPSRLCERVNEAAQKIDRRRLLAGGH